MTNLYLILHKVRGEPAFDIATKLMIGDEEGWIIPTSGHRAYPFKHWDLYSLADIDDIDNQGGHTRPAYKDDLPGDWPDHYSTTREPTKADSAAADDLLASLGLKSNSAKGYLRR